MSYGRYLVYDIFGGLLWVWGMVLLGYTLGRTVPNVDSKSITLLPQSSSYLHAASVPCVEGSQEQAHYEVGGITTGSIPLLRKLLRINAKWGAWQLPILFTRRPALMPKAPSAGRSTGVT